MDFLSDTVEFEQTLMQSKETFVYKVPPLASSSGHRAETFGLENPLFTGLLKVIQKDVKLRIALYRYKDETTLLATPENLVLFGECPIEVEPKGDITPFVDSVVDSSRYFVIRLKDPASSRSVSIGIGFRERETAFDFKSALNEYVRYVDRMCTADEMSKDQADLWGDEDENSSGPVKQMKDMSLKQGEKIHVKGIGKRKNVPKTGGGSGLLGLKPPPPAGSLVHVKTPEEIAASNTSAIFNKTSSSNSGNNDDRDNIVGSTNAKADMEDDDWGDFETCS